MSSIRSNPQQSKFPPTQQDARVNAINRRNDQFDNNSAKAIFATATIPSNIKRNSVQDRLNRNREYFDEINVNQSNESAQLALKS